MNSSSSGPGCISSSGSSSSGCSSNDSTIGSLHWSVPLDARPRGILQPLWLVLKSREALLQSPFFPGTFSFVTYVGFCLPFVILDFLSWKVPALRRYKLNPRASPSPRQMLLCLAQSVYHHLVFIFPLTVARWSWRPVGFPEAAPPLPEVLTQVVGCLLLFDFQYFLWHWLHHKVPWLYRTFHRVHHKHTSAFALATQYSSIWELLSLGFFAAVNPVLLRCHPLTEMTFFLVNIWLSVEDHSGYDFPWSTHRLVPFGLYGGAPHHDVHHLKFKCNYAPYFTHWDWLFGTLASPHPKGTGKVEWTGYPPGRCPPQSDRERRR
ncbi:cholesterol 25-hydroxylase [Ornithorhynchus anatinus]|uniref:Cholesterol 25-hydroxylase n=1 Tax=Ornithorhynchus anatinus TaxID=9258 RepID=A0A6I8PL04_ORNAN|nr:cholesterol 25-hydroxylase [Ornithorhynchus anatinus]